jgi:hypothetical protein
MPHIIRRIVQIGLISSNQIQRFCKPDDCSQILRDEGLFGLHQIGGGAFEHVAAALVAAFGPRSMIQSARRMTSTLCSIAA